jgi:hypothetical protein
MTTGNRGGRLLEGEGRRRPGGRDHIDVQGDEFGNESGKPRIVSFRPSKFDLNVLALDVAEVTKSLAERSDEIGLEGRGRVPQEADPGRLAYAPRRGQERYRENEDA